MAAVAAVGAAAAATAGGVVGDVVAPAAAVGLGGACNTSLVTTADASTAAAAVG